MNFEELYDFLEHKYLAYSKSWFIDSDPIQIPHQFSRKEDIEIAAFLTATIAWGNRKMIIKSAKKMLLLMDNAPFDFISDACEKDLKVFSSFKHRTFNAVDISFFIKSLQHIYNSNGGLEKAFSKGETIFDRLVNFRTLFFETSYPLRSTKHISNPLKNSAAKRLNMFLRWMVRSNEYGVDFGLWNRILPKDLYIPLDVHSGRVARKLGLLKRRQDDWKAVTELTETLRAFDPQDPVKYDFALFGLGVFEKF